MASPDKQSFHVKLSPEHRAWIRQEAYRQDVPMAEVIRQMVDERLAKTREEASTWNSSS